MLTVKVPLNEVYDEDINEFVVNEYFELDLEHSLVSLSKWEQKFEKPFLSKDQMTLEQTAWYIKAMAIDEKTPGEVFEKLSHENYNEINEYINAKMTATWFNETDTKKSGGEIITSEIIYYWMVSLNISMECEHWHLNRLITLIRVTNEKNAPPKKMSPQALAARNRALNEERRRKFATNG